MRALVKAKAQEGIWLQDQPRPEIGPNDVLIEISKTAICGTDIHIYNWDEWSQRTIPVPMTVGHEFVGRVAELGSHVRGFEVGDRVSGEGHITCGHCRNCRAGKRHLCRNTVGVGVNRTGAFAEYLSIPATNAFKLPDDVSDDIAAFLDPLGNAVHTALSFDLVGEDVLITGAGPIGCMAVAICKHVGARHVAITDVNPFRLELAKKLGATVIATGRSEEKLAVVSAQGADHVLGTASPGEDGVRRFRDDVKALTGGEGVDVVYDPVGGAISLESLRCVRFGARFLIVGWASTPFVARGKGQRGAPNANVLPTNLIMMKSLDVLGCPAVISAHRDPAMRARRLAEVLAWAEEGAITPLVAERRPLAEAAQAMRDKWKSRTVGAIVLRPGALLLGGCYQSHGLDPDVRPPDSGVAMPDAGVDAGMDSGLPPWEPPPGVCVPPLEQRRPRSSRDTQERRDLDAVSAALFRMCSPGEGCGRVTFEVGADGRVSRIEDAEGDVDRECAEEALLSLCVPALAGEPSTEVNVCGV